QGEALPDGVGEVLDDPEPADALVPQRVVPGARLCRLRVVLVLEAAELARLPFGPVGVRGEPRAGQASGQVAAEEGLVPGDDIEGPLQGLNGLLLLFTRGPDDLGGLC